MLKVTTSKTNKASTWTQADEWESPYSTFYFFKIFIMHIHTICILVLYTTHARSITVLIPQSLMGLLICCTWHKEAQTVFPLSFSLLFFPLGLNQIASNATGKHQSPDIGKQSHSLFSTQISRYMQRVLLSPK